MARGGTEWDGMGKEWMGWERKGREGMGRDGMGWDKKGRDGKGRDGMR